MESITPESNISAPVIPMVTVTSSEDVQERENDVAETRENINERDNDEKKKDNINNSKKSLTNDRGVISITSASDKTSLAILTAGNQVKSISCPVSPVDMSTTTTRDKMKLPLSRARSASAFTNTKLLSPGNITPDYESDYASTPLTDHDDGDLVSRKKGLFRNERADSDSAMTSTPKKNKRSLKSFRSSFRNRTSSIKKQDEIDDTVDSPLKESNDDIVGKAEKERTKSERRKAKARERKKKLTRMAQKLSERQVLSPSYKQKNEDFHKFFKDLPLAERLLVDYNCALMKDIIIQGRLYVSQNYLCFHSNILKWQTAVVVKLVDIDQMTKEKTVKVIPNAIQCLMKDKTKMTFTSFTARDRAYLTTFRLWQNALLDKPMSASELWSQIHRNYGEELGLCSSDDDYVRPEYIPRKHQPLGDAEGDIGYEFGTTNKVKRKKKSSNSTQTNDDEFDKVHKNESKSNKSSSQDSCNQSTGDEKSMRSSQGSFDDVSLGDDLQDEDEMEESEHLIDHEEEEDGRVIRKSADETKESRKSSKSLEAGDKEIESDDEPSDLALSDCAKISLCRRYETSARDLFRIIFGDCSECTFWKDTLVNKGTTDIEFTTWADDSQVKGQRVRDLSYTLRLDNPIGPKTSHCKEAQILYPSTVIGKSYGVDCIVQNYGIPYADYFQTCMRYCIRKVTRNVCELRISSELRYKKTPWGLIKNFIEKNVASGLNQNFKKLECQLQEQIDLEKTQSQPMVNGQQKTSSNVRRRKRGSESASRESPTHKNRNTPSSRSTSSSSRRRGRSKGNRSDMNNNKGGSTPSEATSPGIPSPLTPNGFIPNSIHKHGVDSPKMLYFGNGAKFIIGAIFFIFILLVYSNYSMYQRLTTLEQVATAAAAADGVNPSVTAALLDRPGVSITDNPEILSTYLQAIDKRLHKLEEMMVTFVETSENKWNNMESEWTTMKNLIRTILQQKATSGGQ